MCLFHQVQSSKSSFMVTLEEINKAAEEFAEREYEIGDIDKAPLIKGYYHGSLDRVNKAWHSSEEFPKKPVFQILAELSRNKFEVTYFVSVREWTKFVKRSGLVRWAYIEDLIPVN